MDKPIYDSLWLNWLFRLVGAIPVESERRHPASIRRALEEIGHALDQGEVVMLFPEGRLTPDGDVQPFPAWPRTDPGATSSTGDPGRTLRAVGILDLSPWRAGAVQAASAVSPPGCPAFR